MLDSYRRVFSYRGAAAFSASGLVARLPVAMMTLGIVLLVTGVSGSYTYAGKVSAAYVLGNAVVAIVQGRLADRFGQRPVLLIDMILFAFFTGGLVRAILSGWHDPWPLLWAAAAGASMPQVGSMVRTRWAHIVSSDAERLTAFAVEAVVDEAVFVTGPALVTFLSTAYAPQTGLLVAVAAGSVGTLLLAAQSRTSPPPQPAHRPGGLDPMPWLRLVPLAIASITLGSLFAALEVVTVAVADDAGRKAVAGLLLAAFSAGSLIAGVVAGAVKWRRSDLRRFQIGVALLSVAMVALPFLDHLPTLGLALFVIGFTLAPTLIAVVSFVESSTPRSRLTEAMAVFQTGLGAGLAPGAWLGGVVADHTVGATAYWVCVGCGVLTSVASWLCREPSGDTGRPTLQP